MYVCSNCLWRPSIKAEIKNFETVYTSAPSFLKIIKSLGESLKLNNKIIQISCDGGAATGSPWSKNDFKEI